MHDVGGEIVDITPVQEKMTVHRVAEGRHVASQRHRGSDVSPETARVVHPHVGHRDVGGDGEVGQPQVLPGMFSVQLSLSSAHLDVGLAESLLDERVEAEAGHHAGVGPGQVQRHPPLLAHLVAEVPRLHRHLGDTVQYSTVQSSIVQYSTVQYSTVQYSTVQFFTSSSHPDPASEYTQTRTW